MLTFLQVQRRTNGVQNWFPESQNLFRKLFHWKVKEVEFPLCMSWHFFATQIIFRKQLCHFMTTYHFSFQAYPSSMSESTFSLSYTSWFPTCIPFWVAHIFPHFQLISCLLNKTIKLPFHDYIVLLSLP